MSKARSVSTIIGSLKSSLEEAGSALSSFSPFSNIYALFRSMAILIAEQDVNLSNLGKSFYISSASGNDLDLRVSDLGLTRHPGTYATGKVLAAGPYSVIEKGTILSSADQTLQFETVESIAIYDESAISVSSINRGNIYNLEAGVRLYSISHPSVTFTVGSYRDPLTKKALLSINGGSDPESDISLRSRASNYMKSLGLGTKIALDTYIKSYVSGRSYIKEHYPVTGYITVYIDTKDARIQEQVSELVSNIKAAGVAYLVKPLNIKKESISLIATTDKPESYQSLSLEIKRRLIAYGDSLGLGQTIAVSTIAGIVMGVDGITNCQVILPQTDITADKEQAIGIDSVTLDLRIEQ